VYESEVWLEGTLVGSKIRTATFSHLVFQRNGFLPNWVSLISQLPEAPKVWRSQKTVCEAFKDAHNKGVYGRASAFLIPKEGSKYQNKSVS